MDQQKTTLKLALTFFEFLGLHPYKKTRKIQVLLLAISHLILLVLVFVQFYYEKITFNLISDIFESTFSLIHFNTKYMTLVIAKPNFLKLLETCRTFSYPENHAFVTGPLRKMQILSRIFSIFVVAAIVVFSFRPIFEDTLAIACYIPEFIPRPVFVIFNNAIFSMSGCAVGAFDMFVCTMVVLVTVQFKVLNHEILNLQLNRATNERKSLEKMKRLVDYHNFLNTFLDEVTAPVSPVFLIYFTLAPITLCFELFFISKSPNLAGMTKSFFYLSGITIQLFFFYCLPATDLMVESENMIKVMYDTGWESCRFPSVRKTVIVMMQRMQKETLLTAGKMIHINLETCTNAFRMALSFYTSLQILDDKAKQN